MESVRPIETWLTAMDGVLVHEEDPIAGHRVHRGAQGVPRQVRT